MSEFLEYVKNIGGRNIFLPIILQKMLISILKCLQHWELMQWKKIF